MDRVHFVQQYRATKPARYQKSMEPIRTREMNSYICFELQKDFNNVCQALSARKLDVQYPQIRKPFKEEGPCMQLETVLYQSCHSPGWSLRLHFHSRVTLYHRETHDWRIQLLELDDFVPHFLCTLSIHRLHHLLGTGMYHVQNGFQTMFSPL